MQQTGVKSGPECHSNKKTTNYLGGHHNRQLLIFNLADFYTTFLKSIPYQQHPAIAILPLDYQSFIWAMCYQRRPLWRPKWENCYGLHLGFL